MFIRELSLEQQKILIDLCILGAETDNDFSFEEVLTIQQFLDQTRLKTDANSYGINMVIEKSYPDKSFDELVTMLVDISNMPQLKMVLAELIVLFYRDGVIEQCEEMFLINYCRIAEISVEIHQDLVNNLVKHMILEGEICATVYKERIT
ncbi:MAG: hypothetical protein ACK5LV_00270 [Lachnospirales bacterium]